MRANLRPALLLSLALSSIPSLPLAARAGSLCGEAEVFANGFHARRTRIACEMRDAILAKYALAYQKEKRITEADGSPFRTGRHLERCVEAEYGIADDESPETRVEFGDRMRACIAGFRDTHLELGTPTGTPWVSLGFSLREIDGAYYIDSVYPRVLAARAAGLGAQGIRTRLIPGTRVLAIDGTPVEVLVAGLEPYVSASSELYRRQEALDRVTNRDFRYPGQPAALVTVSDIDGSNPESIATIWSADFDATTDESARKVLAARGFVHDGLLPWLNQPTNTPLDEELSRLDVYGGYYDQTPAVPVSARARGVSFTAPGGGDDALAFVKVDSRLDGVAHPYCYLQLGTFGSDKVLGRHGFKRDYLAPARPFLRQCRREKLPLVLDLRTNPGGFLSLGDQTQAALTARGTRAASRSAYAYREEAAFREDAAELFDGQYWGENTIVIESRARADRRIGGFDGKVIALTTPSCISSCDRLASLLKTSGRATLLGTPTNGTGAGFNDIIDPITGELVSDWKDSEGYFAMQIPDMLFGSEASSAIPVSATHPSRFSDWVWWILHGRPDAVEYVPMQDFEEAALIENRPTLPDVEFKPALSDLRGESFGWVDAIEKLL